MKVQPKLMPMFRNFNELDQAQQEDLKARFNVPANTDEVLVNEDLIPCELIAGKKVALNVRRRAIFNSFHTPLRHNS